MRRTKQQLLLLLSIVFIAAGCKELYDPPVIQDATSALVVDGFINNSSDTTFIRLTHTNRLSEGSNHAAVPGAQMTLEANGTVIYAFIPLNDSGVYYVPGMFLDANTKYRLHILGNNDEYLSDEITVLKTPPVDSITFEHNSGGVAIAANAHDATNNTHYYRWEYTETFQYQAAHFSGLIFKNGGLRDRLPEEEVYVCWKTQNNNQLLTASTVKLSSDIVYHNTIRFVENNSLELSIKYLIALRQYALTKEAFNYIENLKKITEQTGSIFDAQPSQLTGNIHSVRHPDEVVIGYISASTQETKQLYITNDQVQPWEYKPDCTVFEIPPDKIESSINGDGLIALSIDGGPFNVKGVFVTSHPCGDCTAFGGSTTRPFFFQ